MGNIDILEKLEEYSKAGYVPMHMPGGKRNTEYASTSELDITWPTSARRNTYRPSAR